MEKLTMFAMGFIAGFGVAMFIFTVLKTRKKASSESSGGSPSGPVDFKDNQTT